MENTKIKLNMIGALPQPQIKEIPVGTTTISITCRIPYEQMLKMIQWCIDLIINDRPFISAPLKRIVKELALLKFYTNIDISFVEDFHTMEEIYENYDLADTFGVIDITRENIDPEQLAFFDKTLDETLDSIQLYRNSIVGIIDVLSQDAESKAQVLNNVFETLKKEGNVQQLEDLIKASGALK